MENGVLSVRELSDLIEKYIYNSNLRNIDVEGEISDRNYNSSHLYFTLKEEDNVIKCNLFRYREKNVSANLKVGDKVRIKAFLSYYKPHGAITLNVTSLKTLDDLGNIFKKLEKLKEELRNKGYFDESRKKEKPILVKRLGVVTSATGEAFKDIENTTHKRDKNVDIYLYPVKVQGEGAKEEISKAIKYFNENNDKYNLDAIIVGRGGGSIEDLWAFNEKEVAEAIYNSDIFIVSAVGHEGDVLLSDLVSDIRASTPTQAAEQIIKERKNLEIELKEYKEKLRTTLKYKYSSSEQALKSLKEEYIINNFKKKFYDERYKLLDLEKELSKNLKNKSNMKRNELENLKNIFNISKFEEKIILSRKNELEKLRLIVDKHSQKDILKKGYSITRVNGKIVTFNNIKKGDILETEFLDYKVESEVKDIL